MARGLDGLYGGPLMKTQRRLWNGQSKRRFGVWVARKEGLWTSPVTVCRYACARRQLLSPVTMRGMDIATRPTLYFANKDTGGTNVLSGAATFASSLLLGGAGRSPGTIRSFWDVPRLTIVTKVTSHDGDVRVVTLTYSAS